ncbi:pseudouridine synthase [Alkalimonas sp. MEB108]|uniref:Pseudouridine synthase n=1 Tax=Alkalimonas cellulosilytica TaxID=3058395 RepID=A0ABU7JAA2_9GAMM|nr:pseudouridine synthase [Alkalimonas sp. MEB108]MEE2002765.1 pseudouridine synthase [Alkalimonas sp. MEB108]
MTKLSRSWHIEKKVVAIQFLAEQVPVLSKGRLKDAMAKGAVWLQQGKKQKRLRRAQAELLPGQTLALHYDAEILQRSAGHSQLLLDQRAYSVWWKPAGVLSQGSLFGDHLSLLRQAELQTKRPVHLVHRLDREASGLLLVAHNAAAAASLSQQFQRGQIKKLYHVAVQGRLSDALKNAGELTLMLDGKACVTRFVVYKQLESGVSWLKVDLLTGRKHQIRRHFAAAGHPVMGDPRYGNAHSAADTLALQAVELGWYCPVNNTDKVFHLPEALRLFAG